MLATIGLLTSNALLTAQKAAAPVNKTRQGIAVKGYDVVAYFRQGAPAKGQPQFSHVWNDAAFLFSSAENRDLFAKSPEEYAPQFGGYCAWAVGHNYTADADPEAWKIVDGKLYLNYNKSVQKKWAEDQDRWIMEGERNWPSLHR